MRSIIIIVMHCLVKALIWNVFNPIACSAFIPTSTGGHLLHVVPSRGNQSTGAPIPFLVINTQKIKSTKGTTTSRSNKNPNDSRETSEFQRYNDDAFGLVFLIGGFASQDIVFSSTFLILSALGAFATSQGVLRLDTRIPGILAIISLFVSTLVSSITTSSSASASIDTIPASIDTIPMPAPLEICVCCISLLWGFYKWKKEEL